MPIRQQRPRPTYTPPHNPYGHPDENAVREWTLADKLHGSVVRARKQEPAIYEKYMKFFTEKNGEETMMTKKELFFELVEDHVARGMKRPEAIKHVKKSNQELYDQMMKESQRNDPPASRRNKTQGETRAEQDWQNAIEDELQAVGSRREAVKRVAKTRPQLHARFIASVNRR